MALEQGLIEGTGFGWLRVSKDIEHHQKPIFPRTPSTKTMPVIMPAEMLADPRVLKTFEETPWNECYVTGAIGFEPVDAASLFPGERVRYKIDRNKFDLAAWAARMVDIPDTIDVFFAYDRYASGRPVSVTARTTRKGRVVNVKRNIADGEWIVPQLQAIIADFVRTCPKPPADADKPTTGAHVQALLSLLDAQGQSQLRAFLKRDALARGGDSYSGSSTTIPGSFLIRAGVRKLTLAMTPKSNAVLATIDMRGGHEVKDDESGTSIVLAAEIPTTVAMSLRGRGLGNLVDLPWLSALTIRTVPKTENGKVTFRAFSDNVVLEVGDPVPVDESEIDRRLTHAASLREGGFSDHGVWTEMDVALAPILGTLSRHDLSVVLTKLELYSQVDLERYGHAGWKIKSQGPRIVIETQPEIPITTLGHVAALVPQDRREAA